jgi:hypothetical protein
MRQGAIRLGIRAILISGILPGELSLLVVGVIFISGIHELYVFGLDVQQKVWYRNIFGCYTVRICDYF